MKICLLLFALFALSNAKFERFNENEIKNELENNTKEKFNLLNRKLEYVKNKTHFEFVSKESDLEDLYKKKNIGFKFMATGEGVELNFNAAKNVSHFENMRIVFKKVLYNGTELFRFKDDDFSDLKCMNTTEYKSCVLTTKDNFFTVKVDYNEKMYNKTFNNQVKRFFPTDIKVTTQFNFSDFKDYFNDNDTFTLVAKLKTDRKDHFDNENDDEDEKHFNGNLTYMSFEKYALGDSDDEYPVTISLDSDSSAFVRRDSDLIDDETEHEIYFKFHFNKTTDSLTWDPTFGVTSSFADFSALNGSSASSTIINIFVIGILLFMTKLF